MLVAEPGVVLATREKESPTLAGASIAAVGRTVPSGRVPEPSESALADPAPTPARLAVQAADRMASGMIAVALCSRPKVDIAELPDRAGANMAPSGPWHINNEKSHTWLRVAQGTSRRQVRHRIRGPLADCATMKE